MESMRCTATSTCVAPRSFRRTSTWPRHGIATSCGGRIRSIMVNSGEINGVPVHASHELLTDLLRTELGFRGVVVSDYEDILRLSTVHHVARTRRDAVRMAVNAGIDMSMVPLSTNFIDDVIGLVHAGEISEARIDEAVRRILRLKFEVGLFANPSSDPAKLANVASPD